MTIDRNKLYLMDGSFSLELEKIGFIADKHNMWTAGCSIEEMKAVYKSFKYCGCTVVSTNTYHACRSLIEKENVTSCMNYSDLIKANCDIAKKIYDTETILGSIGPFAVTRRDGSEYSGSYVDETGILPKILSYHLERAEEILKNGISTLLFETVPAAVESEMILQVLEKLNCKAIISFSCKDSLRIRHGELLSDVISNIVNNDHVIGIGVNCTSPYDITGLLQSIDAPSIKKSVFVYPNSGEIWDEKTKSYKEPPTMIDWKEKVTEWIANGANVVGGCCRVGTDVLVQIKKVIDIHNNK